MTEIKQNKQELTPEQIEARRRYQREYRRNHPDAVRRWNKQYWARVVEKAKAEAPTAKE